MTGWHVWRRIALGATLMVLLTGLSASYLPASHLPAVLAAGSANAGWTEVGVGSASGGGISQTVGTSEAASMAIGLDGKPVVAWVEHTPDNKEIYVRRWNGTTWAEMGVGSASGGGISHDHSVSDDPSVAIGRDGMPIVSWGNGFPFGGGDIFVRRWDGTTWAEMGADSASGMGISLTDAAGEPSLAVAPDGTPMVAYVNGTGNGLQIYVKQWNGAAWVEVGVGSASGGGVSNDGTKSLAPSLAIGPDSRPVVAWVDMPIDIFEEIFVRRFDGSSWVEMGAGSAAGGGMSNTPGSSYRPVVAIGTDGQPIIVWDDSNLYLKRWNGSAWVEMGGSASGGGLSNHEIAYGASLAFRPDGMPVVAWSGETGSTLGIYVRRWNGTAWVEMDDGSASGGGISGETYGSVTPSLVIAPDGRPFVAWSQNRMQPGNYNYDIYVRQHAPLLVPRAYVPLIRQE